MSAKLVLRVEWNETVQTCRDSFDTRKFSNLSPEILVQWIAPLLSVTHTFRPLIDTCQQCSTTPANYEPSSLANGVFKIQGFVCKRFLPSPPLPPPFFFGSRPISRAGKIREIPFLSLSLLPNPTETLAT